MTLRSRQAEGESFVAATSLMGRDVVSSRRFASSTPRIATLDWTEICGDRLLRCVNIAALIYAIIRGIEDIGQLQA